MSFSRNHPQYLPLKRKYCLCWTEQSASNITMKGEKINRNFKHKSLPLEDDVLLCWVLALLPCESDGIFEMIKELWSPSNSCRQKIESLAHSRDMNIFATRRSQLFSSWMACFLWRVYNSNRNKHYRVLIINCFDLEITKKKKRRKIGIATQFPTLKF